MTLEPEIAYRDISTRGVRLRVLEAGSAENPALLLVHGFLVSHLEFEELIAPLARHFYVLAPDLPGFGESEKPNSTRYRFGLEAMAEAMVDVIAAFQVGRVHVLGHSMGGAVGLTLAANHPELVQRLVLEDTLSYPFPLSLKARLPLLPLIGGIIFKQLYGRTLFRAYFRDDVFSPGANVSIARVDRHYELFNEPSARESAYAVMKNVVDTRPLVARISRVKAPTLVVWGRQDKLFPVANAHRLSREIAGACLEVFDTGHSPHEERPTEFLSLIIPFLEGRR